MKVLTIDDSKTIRAVVVHYLTPLGLTVLQAGDGLEGLEIMRSALPDLAIVDVTMPNLDGISMLALKARDPLIAGIPVIMLTAGANQEFVLKCMKQGARSYIVKPFEKKTLISKVCKVLKLEPPTEGATENRARGPLVLALDQDEKELLSLTEILLEGCELITALDPRQALRMAQERKPESAWIDLGFDAKGLTELVGALRAAGVQDFVGIVPRAGAVPPVAAQLGITSLLPKPFIRVEVREFAARVLGIFQRYVKREQEICLVQIPGEVSVRGREWLPALDNEVRLGLERAAGDGAKSMLLDFSKVAGPADTQLVSGIIALIEIAKALNLSAVLSVPNEDTLRSFAGYQELKGCRCTRGMADALEYLRREPDPAEAAGAPAPDVQPPRAA